MKESSSWKTTVLGVLSVAAGLSVVLWNQQTMVKLESECEILIAQAAAMGLNPSSENRDSESFQTKKS